MEFIDKKKINKYVIIVLLFLSFGFAEWQSTRGMLAYMSYSYPELKQPAWLFNDITALLIGGIIPLVFYEVVTTFASRMVSARAGGTGDEMKYALRFFYIAANIAIGAIKFVYYASPIVSVYGNVLIDFVVTTVFFALFLWYCAKRYVPNTRWGAMLLSAGGTYLVIEAVLTVLGLVAGVLLA